MDSGEEIPALNESWTFAGAKLFEWIAGFMMFIICSEVLVDNIGKSMPFLVGVMVFSTFSMASVRRAFPDEERGVRNLVMVSCGFAPPGIPRPAGVQPVWSGSPIREMREESEFCQLGLQNIFAQHDPMKEEDGEESLV